MAFHDPYLSANLDPEEASFTSSAIRLTPEPTHMRDASPAPSDHPNGGVSTASLHASNLAHLNASTPSSQGFLTPGEELLSNPSTRASPDPDHFGDLNMNTNPAPSDWQFSLEVPQTQHATLSPKTASAQLLSPVPSSHPSPSVDVTMTPNDSLLSSPNPQNGFGHHLHEPAASPGSDRLSVRGRESARCVSPIVKIDIVSRGDSPDRGSSTTRRPSQSTMYLSPNNADDDDYGDNDDSLLSSGSVVRSHDGTWLRDSTGQAGFSPHSRGNDYVPSPAEMEIQRYLEEKNAGIQSWSASVSVANSEAGDDPPIYRGRKEQRGPRRRAKSTGDPSLQQELLAQRSQPSLPGPGILVHESSGDEYSDDGSFSDSPPVSVYQAASFEYQRPDGQAFSDPFRTSQDEPKTPQSSSAAIMDYLQRTRDMENISRAATWGTRHMSDVDVNSIIGGASMENLTLDEKRKKPERQSSLRKFLPKKTASTLKRQLSEISSSQPSSDNVNKESEKDAAQRKSSFLDRKLSLGRRHSSISTGGAVVAIASQMAAIGGSDSIRAASPAPPSNSWLSPEPPKTRKRRSRSEVPRVPSPGFFDTITNKEPQLANLTYTGTLNNQNLKPKDAVRPGTGDDDDDDDELDDKGLVMDFSVASSLPVPTTEGFKAQITQLNPRLPPALVDRFANEQLRRYKKLVESKLGHGRSVNQSSCKSGKYCFAQGGEAQLLQPRANPQDPDAIHTQFQIPGKTAADAQAVGEGAVTAAQFPIGVPLPPVQRLPAEFECPVCFQVKKFQKPSDWTKHIHEDVQPFTCTFPHCNDPKSFKRKADWVRHETERHRKLEWWSCTLPDCHHTCYRKDNFVQHLVREHKFPEPKFKKTKSRGADSEEGSNEHEIERLWELVVSCRHDTPTSPRDEPCRFCGNICSSWKKLTVHLAKHMEQIAMPVLGLVNERNADVPSGLGLSFTHGTGTDGLASYPSKTEPEGMNLSQGQFSNSLNTNGNIPCQEPATAMSNFAPTYPPPHLATTLPDGMVSAEPESYNSNAYDAYGTGVDPMRSTGGLANETQFIPVQQPANHPSAVTYPPPFVQRAVQNQNHDQQFHLALPRTEPIYDLQGSLCASPGEEHNYGTGYMDSMAQTMHTYDSSMVTDYLPTGERRFM